VCEGKEGYIYLLLSVCYQLVAGGLVGYLCSFVCLLIRSMYLMDSEVGSIR
jgi:hypothetical protein